MTGVGSQHLTFPGESDSSTTYILKCQILRHDPSFYFYSGKNGGCFKEGLKKGLEKVGK